MRVAAECAEDLAADGVVYAEVRFAPELHLEGGLTPDEVVEAVLEGFRLGQRRHAAHRRHARHRHAPRRPLHRDRRAGRAPPRRRRRRLRHRRQRGRQPAHPPPRRVPARRRRELPHHHPRRRGVRAPVDLGGACSCAAPSASATACASSTTSRSTTTGGPRSAGWPASSATVACPLEMCPTSNVNTGVCDSDRASTRSACSPRCGSGSRSTPTTGS